MSALPMEVLALESAELLPPREALDLVHINIANVIAVNTAIAVNAGSWASTASATAGQLIYVNQS